MITVKIFRFFENNQNKLGNLKNSNPNFEGPNSRSNSEGRRMSLKDSKLGYKRSKNQKMSIYSGSFGLHKFSSQVSNEELKHINDQNDDSENSRESEEKNIEDLADEDERIRWIPNDASNNCQI